MTLDPPGPSAATYSFLSWDGTFPVHQVHGSIGILRGHSNEALRGRKHTVKTRRLPPVHMSAPRGVCVQTGGLSSRLYAPGTVCSERCRTSLLINASLRRNKPKQLIYPLRAARNPPTQPPRFFPPNVQTCFLNKHVEDTNGVVNESSG